MKHNRTNFEYLNNFMYFGHNYDHDFIEKAWQHDTFLTKHLREKFHSMYDRYGTMTFFRWYMELDDNNKHVLAHWININYTAFEGK